MDEIDREIHELGQIEGDYSDLARYMKYNGWVYRFLKWMEGLIRKDREELIVERDQMRKEKRDGESGGL